MRSVPRLCEFNPGICLTTEEKHGKTSVRVVKEYCFPLPKHPLHNNTHHIHTHIITEASHIHTVQNPNIHTPTHYKDVAYQISSFLCGPQVALLFVAMKHKMCRHTDLRLRYNQLREKQNTLWLNFSRG